MEIMLTEFNKHFENPYFFENDDVPCYISPEALEAVKVTLSNELSNFKESEQAQMEALCNMETLKYSLSQKNILLTDYRTQLKSIMRDFFVKYGFDVFYDSIVLQKFYSEINGHYNNRKEENS